MKSTKDLRRESWCRGSDSNRVPPEYKSRALGATPTYSVQAYLYDEVRRVDFAGQHAKKVKVAKLQ
jgi:hypothetical protein